MVECSICKENPREAIMHCANCGKPLCEKHTMHGRYCSEICYSDHEDIREEKQSKTDLKAGRSNRRLIMTILFVFILLGVAGIYLIFQTGI